MDDVCAVPARLARGDRPLPARPCRRIAVDADGGTRASRASPASSRERTCARLSRPFPAGIESPVPFYAAAAETVRYVGEPIAVVVARTRALAEDAAELVSVDYDPLDPVLDPVAAAQGDACVHDRSFHYGDVDEALARADLVVRETFTLPELQLHAGRVLRRRLRLVGGRADADRLGELPGPVHAARRGRGLARAPRRAAPAADAARLRRLVRHQVVGLHVRRPDRARCPLARRARAVDRGSARAPRGQRSLDEARDRDRSGLHDRRGADRPSLRRDRGRRRLRPRPRARDALPDARLALGRVPRARRGGPQPRRAHQHAALRPESRLRRAAALLRPRAHDGHRRRRLGLDPADVARRNLVPAEAMPYRTPSGGYYDGGDYARVPRGRARARPLRRAPRRRRRRRERRDASSGSGSRASSSRRSRTWGTSRSPRRPSSAPRGCRSRGTRRVPSSRSTRSGASPCGSPRPHRDRGTAPSARRSSPTSSASLPTTCT